MHEGGVISIGYLNDSQIYSVTYNGELKLWSVSKSSYTCDGIYQLFSTDYYLRSIDTISNNRMYCGYVEGGEDFYLKIMCNEAPFKEIARYKNKYWRVNTILEIKNKEMFGISYDDNDLRDFFLLKELSGNI